jgi:hypothetical protein
VPKQAAVQFIGMLRALDLAVASHGVSHAQMERRLCEWMSEGEKALRDPPGGDDPERLRELVNRKTAVEQSGLARLDGRRDRAGGQRIGELVSGKYPRGMMMPSRRRVEVCVDVFLDFLEENDPTGYAQGMYGTRESWREWWLQADQGHEPEIGDRTITVWGYLDIALEQLAQTTNGAADLDVADGRRVTVPAGGTGQQWSDAATRLPETREETGDQLDRARPEEQARPDARARLDAPAEAEPMVAAAHAERDEALERAREAGELLDQARAAAQAEADLKVAAAHAERDRAIERARKARLRAASTGLAVAFIATATAVTLLVIFKPTHTVQLATRVQDVTATEQATFPFTPLPEGKDWTLHLTLSVTPTDPISACTYGMKITAQVEADGDVVKQLTYDHGKINVPTDIYLNHKGSDSLRFVVTRLVTDPECKLRLDLTGSTATATAIG